MRDSLRDDALAIWREGVRGVDARRLVREGITLEGDAETLELAIGDAAFDARAIRRVVVVGAGKAGAAMTLGLEDAFEEIARSFGRTWDVSGWVNVPAGTEQETRWVRLHAARPAGVNEPTERGVEGSREIIQRVRAAGPSDLVVVLLSGGGSALLPLPAEGITLEDKVGVTRLLSGHGADIEQLNVVRKQISAIKGGKLAAACPHAPMVTLVISDVLGDRLEAIASGPTVPDVSTPQDALKVLARFDPDREAPSRVYEYLERQMSRLAVSPTTRDDASKSDAPLRSVTILGNNAVAVDTAGMEAERRGYSHAMTSARRSEGSAEEVGRHLAETALTMLGDSHGGDEPDCWISGGEPVVTLVPAERRGRGGRNQQLVLAALDHLMSLDPPLSMEQRQRLFLVSGGTDGEDGPTDAAGAFLDADVWQRAEALGLQPAEFLSRNDAYAFFDATGGLLRTGPTHTNVCDLRVLLVARPNT